MLIRGSDRLHGCRSMKSDKTRNFLRNRPIFVKNCKIWKNLERQSGDFEAIYPDIFVENLSIWSKTSLNNMVSISLCEKMTRHSKLELYWVLAAFSSIFLIRQQIRFAVLNEHGLVLPLKVLLVVKNGDFSAFSAEVHLKIILKLLHDISNYCAIPRFSLWFPPIFFREIYIKILVKFHFFPAICQSPWPMLLMRVLCFKQQFLENSML